jgi:YbgC/YbaW family acyl-CoA thioester hydrolase
MFVYERLVYLKETDATGVIYFGSLFQYALEAFEAYLIHKGYPLSKVFDQGYLMPIVHAEADYKAPLRTGDLMEVELVLFQVGTRSFTMDTVIYTMPTRKIAGRVKIVHAFLYKGQEVASEIPPQILAVLQNS